MNKELKHVENENIYDEFDNLSDLNFGKKSEDEIKKEVEPKIQYVEENLWYKVEKVGKKISFEIGRAHV